MVDRKQMKELVLQSLEHERGGVKIYETALRCTINDDLHEEWQEYLKQTGDHVRILEDLCVKLDMDPEQASPGRSIVGDMGAVLVGAMHAALAADQPDAAQLVACDCVVLAETKDHANWELLAKCSENLKGDDKRALTDACKEVEDQEDEHLYHTKGWCRELWIKSLGMKAILPPPEERKDVKTAIGASRAQQASEKTR